MYHIVVNYSLYQVLRLFITCLNCCLLLNLMENLFEFDYYLKINIQVIDDFDDQIEKMANFIHNYYNYSYNYHCLIYHIHYHY